MRTGEDEFYATHIVPDASDEEIANKVAGFLVEMFPSARTYHLSIIHDVRPAALRKLERMQKIKPGYLPDNPVGPCPLRHDWTIQNIVGITTLDPAAARQWAVEAMLAGYCVFRRQARGGDGYGRGSIADLRKSWRTENA